MDGLLKQSTSATVIIGPFLDDTDGKTPKTSLSIGQSSVRLSKNGGSFAQKNDSNSCTHLENGYYSCSLNSTDTNTAGRLTVAINISGALPVWHTYMILTSNAYDSLVSGSSYLSVNTIQVSGTSQTARDLGANIDATISSRAPASTALSNTVWTDAKASYLDATISSRSTLTAQNVWEYASRTLTSFGTLISDIWSYSSRTLTSFGTLVSDIWSYSSRTLTSFGTLVSDIWSYSSRTLTSLGSSLVSEVWNALTNGMTTTGSIGKKLADWVLGSDNKVLVSNNTHTAGVTVADITTKTGYSLASDQSTVTIGTVNALGTQAKADVNAEVLDVLNTDTFSEPSQEAPPATTTIVKKISYLYKFLRNKVTQTSTTISIYNDNETTVDHKATISDDGSTFTKGEFVSGP